MMEFKPETRWYMFFAARVFGKRLNKNVYQWRDKIWICGEITEDGVE